MEKLSNIELFSIGSFTMGMSAVRKVYYELPEPVKAVVKPVAASHMRSGMPLQKALFVAIVTTPFWEMSDEDEDEEEDIFLTSPVMKTMAEPAEEPEEEEERVEDLPEPEFR